MASKWLLVLATCLACAVAYWGPDLPPGPYCGSNNQCCSERQDQCSHKILDTLCYCDEFCGRNRQNDDCCPDYEPVCLGQPPPATVVEPCQHKGKFYPPNEKRKENCNTCTCVLDQWTNQTKWECTDDICIIGANVAQDVNRLHAGWRATNYTQFLGRKLKDGLIYKLGTFPVEALTRRMNPLSPPHKNVDFPPEFDARKRWPKYISAPRDQGWCGSDWAVSLTTVASDRFAIQSKGAESLVLSPQMLLSCNEKGQQGCKGGHVDGAWIYARMQGLVDEDCFPYKAVRGKCPFKKGADLMQDGCTPSVPERSERYKVSPPGRLKGERSIMADIKQSGPVQAIMTVYQDFFHYRDGIYRHTRAGNNRLNGLHSVRIIGWGEENGQKYWIVSNSWGQEWGENGYFRIARGDNESGIESFVLTALPVVAEAYQRK